MECSHNQRIERLWRDVFGGCLLLFYELFLYLESSTVLDVDDELWCLHFVFLTVINSHLTNWKSAWVHHSLRSEKNRTPMQLWMVGLQRVWGAESTISTEVFQVYYYSTMMSFYHIRSREGAKYQAVIHCSVLV